MILWLDDVRPPWKFGYLGAEWVKTADEAIVLLRTGQVTRASLDHDLSVEATMGKVKPGEKTGYDVVLWLEEHPEFFPRDGVLVHSANPVGKQRMLAGLEAIKRRLKTE